MLLPTDMDRKPDTLGEAYQLIARLREEIVGRPKLVVIDTETSDRFEKFDQLPSLLICPSKVTVRLEQKDRAFEFQAIPTGAFGEWGTLTTVQ